MREHPFFADIDFVKLLRREVTAPHVPVISHPTDTSNIDYYEEDEEDSYELLEHDPLLFEGFPFGIDDEDHDGGDDLEAWTGEEHCRESMMVKGNRATSIEFDPGSAIALPANNDSTS